MATGVALIGLVACQPVDHNPPTTPGTQRIVLYGDSVPSGLVGAGASSGLDRSRYTLLNATISACDSALPFFEERSGTGETVELSPDCPSGWRSHYPPWLATKADTAIVMGGVHTMLDHRINGVWAHPCGLKAFNWARNDMIDRITYLKEHASRVVIVLPAWPGPKSRFIMPADYLARADCVRQALAEAADTQGAALVDLGTYLCPTSPTACRAYRDVDGIHIDHNRSAEVLRWVLDTATTHSG